MLASRLIGRVLTAAALFVIAPSPSPAKAPANWDGLAKVPAKNVDYLYLRPGAEFRQYKAIILEPTQVAFKKNWQRDMNRSRSGLSKVSDSKLRKAIDESQEKVRSTFEKRFRETGFQIVTAPAENALKVTVGIVNVDVSAPELNSATSRTFAEQAGYGTLVIEVREFGERRASRPRGRPWNRRRSFRDDSKFGEQLGRLRTIVRRLGDNQRKRVSQARRLFASRTIGRPPPSRHPATCLFDGICGQTPSYV